MKYLLIKDKKKRNLFKKYELKRVLLKSIIYNLNLKQNIREYIFLILNNFTKNTSKTQIHNRCIITNRSRFLFIDYKISRLEFKRLVVLGKLTGVYRKIW